MGQRLGMLSYNGTSLVKSLCGLFILSPCYSGYFSEMDSKVYKYVQLSIQNKVQNNNKKAKTK